MKFLFLIFFTTATFYFNPNFANQQKTLNDSIEIEKIVSSLDTYKALQKTINIQHEELSCAMKKALVISQLLISATGNLNIHLIDQIKNSFISDPALKYEVNIGHVLDQLDNSWQQFFDHIKKPNEILLESNILLRGLFGLSPDEYITDNHAKIAILAAMLAPYNQGPVGDCFAVAVLVRNHEEYFKHSAIDYRDIIQKGYISRKVTDNLDNFFFIPVIADLDLHKFVLIDSFGHINGSSLNFLEAPGFRGAFNVMGGKNISNFSEKVLKDLFIKRKVKQIKVSVIEVICSIAKIIASEKPQMNPEEIVKLGSYAFSCLTNNPILRATECAFSAMAEDRPHDYLRYNTLLAVAKSCQGVWNTFKSNAQLEKFQNIFLNQFNNSFRFIYNPSIKLVGLASDGNSSMGGFQLYKRIPNHPELMGIKVTTPYDFRQLVIETVAETKGLIGQDSEMNKIREALESFIYKDSFLKAVLWNFDSQNPKEKNPILNYKLLARTPMESCTGDDPYEVSDIDTGKEYKNDILFYSPKNSLDLIKWCLNLSKQAPSKLLPMDSSQHAFNFDPTNSDIINFLKSGLSPDNWIRQQLDIPGLQIANHLMSQERMIHVSTAMFNILQDFLSNHYEYKAMTDHLSKKPITIQKYGEGLLAGIKKLIFLDAYQTDEVARILDVKLIESLSLYDRTLLEQSAIRFAFSNWNDGIKDIYFCAFFNPRTLKIAFGCIDEDKTNLFPLNEIEWVNNKQWDIDLRAYPPPDIFMATGTE